MNEINNNLRMIGNTKLTMTLEQRQTKSCTNVTSPVTPATASRASCYIEDDQETPLKDQKCARAIIGARHFLAQCFHEVAKTCEK